MKIGSIFAIILASIVSFVGVSYTNNQTDNNIPIEGYRVYLDGKTIGLIESKEALEAVYKDIVDFAEAEQLTAHANSIRVRFEEN